MITVGELKRIIAESGLLDDAEVYLGESREGLAKAFPAHLVVGGGLVVTCNDEAAQVERLARVKPWSDRFPGDYRAVRALILLNVEDPEDAEDAEDDDCEKEDRDNEDRGDVI